MLSFFQRDISRPARLLRVTLIGLLCGVYSLAAGAASVSREDASEFQGNSYEAAAHLTRALIAQQKKFEKAHGLDKEAQQDWLLALAEKRHTALSELMESDSAEIFRVAIPDDRRTGMPEEVQALLLRKMEVSGALEILLVDFEDGSHQVNYSLKTAADERFTLHLKEKPAQKISGIQVMANGLFLSPQNPESDGDIALQSTDSLLTLEAGGSGTGSGQAALPYTLGEQRALVILVNFQDQSSNRPWTKDEINQAVFGDVSEFFQENSFGQTWLAGDVAGWFTLPLNSTDPCDHYAISNHARQFAASTGYDLSGYQRLVYIFPQNSCGWAGLGTVGGYNTNAWINGTPSTYYLGHELGHNYGLYHSQALDCSVGSIEGSCFSITYGDKFDAMGSPNHGHFNAYQKERLGWFEGAPNATLTTVDSSGVYSLGNYEFPSTLQSAALKILKEVNSTTGERTWYYIEPRQDVGFDSFVSSNNVLNGLIIHTGSELDVDSSFILDMTPGSSTWFDFDDPALPTSAHYADANAGITIFNEWTNENGASVSITLDETAPPPPTCTHLDPLISISPGEAQWASAASAVVYAIEITNSDDSICGYATFSLSANPPVGWNVAFDQNSVNLPPGEAAAVNLTVTSSSSAEDGFYDISISASGNGLNSVAVATYVVDNPVTNTVPVAAADSASTEAGIAVEIAVLANDFDSDDDTLTITSVSGGGSTVINASNTITYYPAEGFSGNDSFSYSISDGRGGTDSAAVNIIVAAALNTDPVAIDDLASTVKGQPVVINVMANDSDADGDNLSILSFSQASKGTVSINDDDTLIYTPAKNFKNSDSFSYTITDGKSSTTATVTVQTASDGGGGSSGGGRGNGKKK